MGGVGPLVLQDPCGGREGVHFFVWLGRLKKSEPLSLRDAAYGKFLLEKLKCHDFGFEC
jgi:hypothetical protein